MQIKAVVSSIVLCLFMLNTITVSPASAAKVKVRVTIPSFAVEVNGKKIDNKRALYPPLLYKDVTYFPMTSNYTGALGLSVQWNHETGLAVQSDGARIPLKEDHSGQNSLKKAYDAQVAPFPIKVNDEVIDNTAQKYPILLFRDITYFPMTWHFTHVLFKWDTEWSSETGFHIRSGQVPVLFDIVGDDASFLYVSTGTEGMYKINKELNGSFERASDQELEYMVAKSNEQARKYALPQSAEAELTEKDNTLYYNEQQLMSLQLYLEKITEYETSNPHEKSGIDYSADLIQLDEASSLLIVSIFYLTHIPGPYTPHVYQVFIIHHDQVKEIGGYTQWPSKLIRNTDGGYWISSHAPSKSDLNTRNFDRLAQLAYIDKNGTAYNINQQMDAKDIDVLYADHQLLLTKAYNDRLDPRMAAKTDGFYTIDAQLTVAKIADSITGIGFVGQDKEIFVLNPDKNTITNVTKKKSYRWWDYELRFDL